MFIILNFLFIIRLALFVESCISFICINSCGLSSLDKGYKLILLNNRDEVIDRLTKSAAYWSNHSETKVYGPLDAAVKDEFGTWIGINEFGMIGNLLIYMYNSSYDNNKVYSSRGNIVGEYLKRNHKTKRFLSDLEIRKSNYKGFNLMLFEMSEKTGNYKAYYYNNEIKNDFYNNSININDNTQRRVFSISNNNFNEKFMKEIEGVKVLEQLLYEYGNKTLSKQVFINKLFNNILFNTKKHYPDDNLAKFLNIDNKNEKNTKNLKRMSSINAQYGDWWVGAQTRTSTLILVDYDNRVEYIEFNLTSPRVWSSRNETFNLNTLKKKSNNMKSCLKIDKLRKNEF
jgi:uncharacterized protein with NRDE domain